MKKIVSACRSATAVYLIPVLAVLYLFMAVPRLHYPELTHGDEYQDAETMITGTNYVKFGFIPMRFLPQLVLQQDSPSKLYTHYPPLPLIINGGLRMLARTDSLVFFRFLALCCSFVTVAFWYMFMVRLSGSRGIGFLCALLYMGNPYFIYGMDSFSEYMYADLILMIALYMFARMAAGPPRRSTAWHIALWLVLLVESLFSFEYIIFMTVFFVLFRYLMRVPGRFPSWKVIVFYSSASVAGFFLHVLQNAWYLGSLTGAVNDLVTSAAYRIGGKNESSLNLFVWWNQVLLRHISLAFVFNLFAWGIAVFCSYLAYQPLRAHQKQRVMSLLRFFAVIFVAGLTWYIFFPSHSFVHAYVNFLVRHLSPAAAVGFTAIALIFWYRISGKNTALKRIFWCAGVAGVVAAGVLQSDLPVTAAVVQRERDFLPFKECLLKLRGLSGQKDIVGLNYHRHPFISYYTDRYCVRYYDKTSLAVQEKLPKFFIFLPYASPLSAELLAYLNEKYSVLYNCSSARFPAVFFELKKS